jgi:UDP-N-acetylmuramate dehydrogenase
MIKITDLPITKGKYRENAKLTNWFNTGGNAEILFRPNDKDDLALFLKKIDKNININIIGAGSNIIISDDGVKGITIRLGKEFSKISHNQTKDLIEIHAGSSALCANVANYARDFGFSGLEFLSTIPGSIGGAIAMNAGCYDGEISKVLKQTLAIDYQGNQHILENHDFNFSYRFNQLAQKFIFVEGVFNVEKSSFDNVNNKMLDFQKQRELSQPIRAKTGGSTFKNPNGYKAWELIDGIGFRGKKIGDAQFSEKHCNFLINTGDASSQNLIDLGNQAIEMIEKKYRVKLEWEIKILK